LISTKDQEDLFFLIANYLEQDISCMAIGGTAMMFEGYKNTTKDIDLVFENVTDRNKFIDAIKKLGYKERSLAGVYDEKRRKDMSKPVMYSRGEERFDLFVKNVFGFKIRISQEAVSQRRDFIGKKELIIYMPQKELIILLKAITGREKDFEDIETIIKMKQDVDWDKITNEAVKQRKSNEWILIDLEETMQKLKKITLIKEKYFENLYGAENKAR